MNATRRFLIFALPISLAAAGCDFIVPDAPRCQITSEQRFDATSSTFASTVLTATNVGNDRTAYNVSCDIDLVVGSTVIERETVYFGTIDPGQSVVGEAWFTMIESHGQYDFARYHLYWYDDQDGYYD